MLLVLVMLSKALKILWDGETQWIVEMLSNVYPALIQNTPSKLKGKE